ncbi:MAG: TorF family putative porin [Candidatus Omnitrophota bacterium]
MKKIIVILTVELVLSIFTFVCAQEEGLFSNSGFEITGDMSVFSQYVWRGMILDRDVVLQPGFYIASPKYKFGRLKAGIWANQPLQNRDNLKSEEVDYIIDYTYDFKKASFSLGHTYYDFIEADTYTREFYIGLSFSELFLNPSVYFYRDYGKPENGGGQGSYTLISVSHTFSVLPDKLNLELSGHVGFNHELFINGNGQDIGVKAGIAMSFTKNLTFVPNLNYSIPLADLRSSNDGNQKDRFYGGATMAYVF